MCGHKGSRHRATLPRGSRIGLTGGIGSGKSLVAHFFSQHQIPIVDADTIARGLITPGDPYYDPAIDQQMVAYFQPRCPRLRGANGQWDRPALRAWIFSHPADKQWLEQLLHPRIRTLLWEHPLLPHAPYGIWMIPLLLENPGLCTAFNRNIYVDAPPSVRIARVTARDHCTVASVQAIIDSQITAEQAKHLVHDWLINAENDPNRLREQVNILHQQYLDYIVG